MAQVRRFEAGVVLIELQSHPNSKGDFENRFNLDTVVAMNEILDKCLTDGTRAIVISGGEGKFFSNGHDIEWLERNFENGQAHKFIIEYYKLLARYLSYPLPTVAAINGHAFAGGCLIAMAQDYRVMRKGRGFICMNEIDMVPENNNSRSSKITPGCFKDADLKMITLLKCKIAPLLLRDMLLQGKRFDAIEAHAKQIVDLAADDALVVAIALAQDLGKKAHKQNRRTINVLKFETHRESIRILSNEEVNLVANL